MPMKPRRATPGEIKRIHASTPIVPPPGSGYGGGGGDAGYQVTNIVIVTPGIDYNPATWQLWLISANTADTPNQLTFTVDSTTGAILTVSGWSTTQTWASVPYVVFVPPS
jgi:hypothetical protein